MFYCLYVLASECYREVTPLSYDGAADLLYATVVRWSGRSVVRHCCTMEQICCTPLLKEAGPDATAIHRNLTFRHCYIKTNTVLFLLYDIFLVLIGQLTRDIGYYRLLQKFPFNWIF